MTAKWKMEERMNPTNTIDPGTLAEVPQQLGFFSAVIHHHFAGGLAGMLMFGITLTGLISLLIVVERVSTLYLKTQFNKESILSEIRNAIYSGRLNVGGATIIHQIIGAGFQAFERSKNDTEIQIAIDSAASKYLPTLEKRTGYLTTLANISTLLGLLGTIAGLIVSFAGASASEVSERARLLSQGISEAMTATAYGLLVAIPTLMAYAFLQGRTQNLVDDVNEVVLDAMNFVVQHREQLQSKK